MNSYAYTALKRCTLNLIAHYVQTRRKVNVEPLKALISCRRMVLGDSFSRDSGKMLNSIRNGTHIRSSVGRIV